MEYEDDLLWDALIFEPIPVFAAQHFGSTHIVTLLIKPKNDYCKKNLIEDLFLKTVIGKKNKELLLYHSASSKEYSGLLKSFWNTENSIWRNPLDNQSSFMLPIAIENSVGLQGASISYENLLAGAMAGYKASWSTLTGAEIEVMQQLRTYPRN